MNVLDIITISTFLYFQLRHECESQTLLTFLLHFTSLEDYFWSTSIKVIPSSPEVDH